MKALLDLSRLEGYPVPLLERLVDGGEVTPIEVASKVSSSRSTNAFLALPSVAVTCYCLIRSEP